MSEKRFYEGYWSNPESFSDPLTPKRLELLHPFLPQGGAVLDLGCGRGDALNVLGRVCARAVGVDLSMSAARFARRGGDPVVQASTDALPFRSDLFDAVYCGDVIEHVLRPDRLLVEAGRVLRPGGVLAISTPYHGFFKNLTILLSGKFDSHFAVTGPHIRFFSQRALHRLMGGAGLERVLIYTLGRFPPLQKNLFAIYRKRTQAIEAQRGR